MKQVIITPDNLHKQKLSDIMESLLYDIDRCTKAGIKMDMDTLVDISPESKDICTACLAGVALLGFSDNPSKESRRRLYKAVYSNSGWKVYPLFKIMDGWRRMSTVAFFDGVKSLGISHTTELRKAVNDFFYWTKPYEGKVTNAQLKILKEDIKRFVALLRKHKA